jgi:hypothetical protein
MWQRSLDQLGDGFVIRKAFGSETTLHKLELYNRLYDDRLIG